MDDGRMDNWRPVVLDRIRLALRLPPHLIPTPSTDDFTGASFRAADRTALESIDIAIQREGPGDHPMTLWLDVYEALAREQRWSEHARSEPQPWTAAALAGDLVAFRYTSAARPIVGYLWVARRDREVLTLLYRCGGSRQREVGTVIARILGTLAPAGEDPLAAYRPVMGEALSREDAHALRGVAVTGRIRECRCAFEPEWVMGGVMETGGVHCVLVVVLDDGYEVLVTFSYPEIIRYVDGARNDVRKHAHGDWPGQRVTAQGGLVTMRRDGAERVWRLGDNAVRWVQIGPPWIQAHRIMGLRDFAAEPLAPIDVGRFVELIKPLQPGR